MKLGKILKKVNAKKALQAGALIAEAGSRGSAGNAASKILETELDFSDIWRSDENNSGDVNSKPGNKNKK